MALDVKQLKVLALAYMGDAVYELYIREHLIESGQVKPDRLHQYAIQYVSAKAQSAVLLHWLDNAFLTEEEISIVRRGRNAKSRSAPKHTRIQTYRYSTAFEALLGYHHLLKHEDRLNELCIQAVALVEEGNDVRWTKK